MPYILASQNDKHVSCNTSLDILDNIVQLSVGSRTISAPMSAPLLGDCWIVGPAPTGDWLGHANDIACWSAVGWLFMTPEPGWRAWVLAEALEVVFTSGGWAGSVGQGQISKLGIQTPADATNVLAVSGPAVLLTADTASHCLKLNKATTSATGTLAFQSAYSTRAEIGLAGNDKLTFKVSPNGSSFTDALVIDQASSFVGIGTGTPSCRLQVNGPVRVAQYGKASLPSANTSGAGAMIYVSDDVGGATLAFSDGTVWRRVTDRAIIS